jgi:hypothetical protein
MDELWDLWFPNAGATGLSFARCRVGADAAAGRVLVHAAPAVWRWSSATTRARWSPRAAGCAGAPPGR